MMIIAHRGASNLAPQNTLAAFKKAVEINADGVETDVHLTKDGEVVLCHNYEIDETSNGTGKICDMTLEQLKSFDFGSKFSREYADEKIPTLNEFLDCCRELKKIIIEIKTPENGYDLVDKTVKTVKDAGLLDKTVFSSFSNDVLSRCKTIDQSAKTAMLFDVRTSFAMDIIDDPYSFCKQNNVDELHPIIFFISEEFVKKCSENSIGTYFWTINDAGSKGDLLKLGITGIITDVPELFIL